MLTNVYAVFDEKAKNFGAPFCTSNDNLAMRSFNDAAATPGSVIHNHPEDFKLYQLGTFDDNSGKLTTLELPEFISHAQLQLKLETKDAPSITEETTDP